MSNSTLPNVVTLKHGPNDDILTAIDLSQVRRVTHQKGQDKVFLHFADKSQDEALGFRSPRVALNRYKKLAHQFANPMTNFLEGALKGFGDVMNSEAANQLREAL